MTWEKLTVICVRKSWMKQTVTPYPIYVKGGDSIKIKELIKAAESKDYKRTMDLLEVYSTSDMPYDELTAHLKIIAAGD